MVNNWKSVFIILFCYRNKEEEKQHYPWFSPLLVLKNRVYSDIGFYIMSIYYHPLHVTFYTMLDNFCKRTNNNNNNNNKNNNNSSEKIIAQHKTKKRVAAIQFNHKNTTSKHVYFNSAKCNNYAVCDLLKCAGRSTR